VTPKSDTPSSYIPYQRSNLLFHQLALSKATLNSKRAEHQHQHTNKCPKERHPSRHLKVASGIYTPQQSADDAPRNKRLQPSNQRIHNRHDPHSPPIARLGGQRRGRARAVRRPEQQQRPDHREPVDRAAAVQVVCLPAVQRQRPVQPGPRRRHVVGWRGVGRRQRGDEAVRVLAKCCGENVRWDGACLMGLGRVLSTLRVVLFRGG